MEGPKELVERIGGDVEKLLSMYDTAEKCYGYENVAGPRVLNDQQQRLNNIKMFGESPEALLTQGSGMSFLFVYMMSGAGAKGLFDLS